MNEQPNQSKRTVVTNKVNSEEKSGRVEQPVQDGSLPKDARETCVAQGYRIGVLIVSYRPRILDDDNFTGGGKYIVDGLRLAGYIADDDSTSVKVFYKQVKCKTAEEKTEIYLFSI